MSEDETLRINTIREYPGGGNIPKPIEEETKEEYRLIIKETEYDFEGQRSVKFVSYGERHVDNGCLRIIIGEEDFLFDLEQVADLREFLESEE